MMWRKIPFWGRYEISEYGDVRSVTMAVGAKGGGIAVRKGRVLTPIKNKGGYLAVTLTNGEIRPQILVHRLVARTFKGECPIGLQVRHYDGNKTNNHFSNLRYGTAKENAADAVRHGTRGPGEKHPMAKLTRIEIKDIRNSCESGVMLSKKYGVCPAHISAIRHNRVWKGVF